MNREFAKKTAEKVIEALSCDDEDEFWEVLNPVLETKVPFPLLDEIAKLLGQAGQHDIKHFFRVFDEVVDADKIGGYVIIGQALSAFFELELEASINKAKEIIIKGKKWYVCDIVGERVFGQALVYCFDRAFPILEQMTVSDNMHIRRSIGVAVHFFAKRRPTDIERLERLLTLLSPLIEDRQVYVVKGVGWGLKTIGKYQPKLIEEYLWEKIDRKRISKLMLSKATTYLGENAKMRLFEHWAGSG